MALKKTIISFLIFSLLVCFSSLPSYSQTANDFQVILKQIHPEFDYLEAELWFHGADTLGGIELAVEIDSTKPSEIQFDFNAQDSTLPEMNYLWAWNHNKGIVLALSYSVENDSIHDLDCFTAIQTRKLGKFIFGKKSGLQIGDIKFSLFLASPAGEAIQYKFLYDGFTVVHNAPAPEIPKAFDLKQNFPNPFVNKTTVSFNLPTESSVKIIIYDANGKEVYSLQKSCAAGQRKIALPVGTLASGMYFIKVSVGESYQIKKMVKIR